MPCAPLLSHAQEGSITGLHSRVVASADVWLGLMLHGEALMYAANPNKGKRPHGGKTIKVDTWLAHARSGGAAGCIGRAAAGGRPARGSGLWCATGARCAHCVVAVAAVATAGGRGQSVAEVGVPFGCVGCWPVAAALHCLLFDASHHLLCARQP